LKCGNLDNNKHRIKQCTISKDIWDWVLNKLTHNLSIPIEDPEELLSRPLDKKGEAGLWLVTAAVHYNIHNFWDGSLEKFKDMVRARRWLDKSKLEKNSGTFCTFFENLLNKKPTLLLLLFVLVPSLLFK
jgi:hypothetical protein